MSTRFAANGFPSLRPNIVLAAMAVPLLFVLLLLVPGPHPKPTLASTSSDPLVSGPFFIGISESGTMEIQGTVENRGDVPMAAIQVLFRAWDSQGKLIHQAYGSIGDSFLGPGAATTYRIPTGIDPEKVHRYRVTPLGMVAQVR